ncbi:MAG: GAF domain-containing protein [Magnetococcales bacterium]|nr:GAF domain-containing protein [Magnetococcales bacterium]
MTLTIEAIKEELLKQQRQQIGMMHAAIVAMQHNPALQEAMIAQDRERMQRDARGIFQELRRESRVTHLYFHRAERDNFLRVHQPDRHDDRIDRVTLQVAAETLQPGTGMELGPLGTFVLRVVLPWEVHGRLIGFVELGKEIDDNLNALKIRFGIDLFLFVPKQRLDRESWRAGMRLLDREDDWERFAGHVLIGSSFAMPHNLDRMIGPELSDPTADKTLPYRTRIVEEKRLHLFRVPIKGADVSADPASEPFLIITKDARQDYHESFLLIFLAGVFGIVAGLVLVLLFLRLQRTLEKKLLHAKKTERATQNALRRLNDIGAALSAQQDPNRLLETILLGAKELTNADAGTLYSVTERQTLKFECLRTDSLGIAMGGTTGVPIHFPELPLHKDGEPNLRMVATYAALKGSTVNIPDAYQAQGFDFSGTRSFDQRTNYRSQSFLTMPLKNHENVIIGVLQLINAKDPVSGGIVAFTDEQRKLAESLASQAAIALSNQHLIADLKRLFESFIQSIATAIDDKSPYTGGHCHRVPVLTEMLARAVHEADEGVFKGVILSEEDRYELKIASWLHDCGKVVTPTEVVDKGTKLETLFDRIRLIDLRFEVVKRDLRIAALERRMVVLAPAELARLAGELEEESRRIDEDREFVRESNIGGEFMSSQRQERIRAIARRRWIDEQGREQPFLTDNEVYNLNIPKGTINAEERGIINNHVVATLRMLGAIPFPRHLARVPEIAGAHHEQVNGKGYPRGLTGDQVSMQARMVAIADVFEALTARDRPYKKGKSLSASLRILGTMMREGHIDPDLFKLFIDKGIFAKYAREFMDPEQIDPVDLSTIPGYVPQPDAMERASS